MNVRDTQQQLLASLAGNAQVTLTATNAPGKSAGKISFVVECLKGATVTNSGTFNLIIPSFQGTLMMLDSPDFKDDPDQAIYENPESVSGKTFFPALVRIDRFR